MTLEGGRPPARCSTSSSRSMASTLSALTSQGSRSLPRTRVTARHWSGRWHPYLSTPQGRMSRSSGLTTISWLQRGVRRSTHGCTCESWCSVHGFPGWPQECGSTSLTSSAFSPWTTLAAMEVPQCWSCALQSVSWLRGSLVGPWGGRCPYVGLVSGLRCSKTTLVRCVTQRSSGGGVRAMASDHGLNCGSSCGTSRGSGRCCTFWRPPWCTYGTWSAWTPRGLPRLPPAFSGQERQCAKAACTTAQRCAPGVFSMQSYLKLFGSHLPSGGTGCSSRSCCSPRTSWCPGVKAGTCPWSGRQRRTRPSSYRPRCL
mmetsp:Transcript_109595/g.353756  ORF Transcript_109595/g.353756 Transcript_109595/m.353756 type:complete len:314 (+) Transcript_109595:1001-1942(+)